MNTQYAKPSNLLRLTIIFSIFLSSFIPLQPAYAQDKTLATMLVDHAGGARNQIEVTLTAEQAAVPGSVVTLQFDAKPWHDAPDLAVTWNLPNGGELIDGPATESLGAIKKNQIAHSSRRVRFPSEGVYQLGVVASYKPLPAAQYAAAGVLFFTVKTDGTASVSDKDPNAISPMGSEIPITVDQSMQSADVHSTNGDPCFNVTGNVNRIDKLPTPKGYAPDVRIPVRNAKVTMKEEDTLFDDSYGEQTTDINGNFSFSFCDDDGWFDDTLELYIQLRAEIKSGGHEVAAIEDSSYIDEVYEFKSGKVESDGGNITINMNLTEAQSEVFNIGDAILDAWNVWNANGGAAGDDPIFDYSAEVHWEPGYGDSVSYYDSNFEYYGLFAYPPDEITIRDDPSNSDQWDDSVIMHEWTHMADDKYGCDDNPGGIHKIGQLTDDTELAWGEGYPDYNQSAIRLALGVPNSNFYLDNIYPNSTSIVLDLENFSPSMPSLFSEYYENAIAAMLLDLNDATNDGQDRVFVGPAQLQQVYTDPTFTSNGGACDVRTYLKAWRAMGKPTDALTAAAITQNIGLSNPFAVLAADANQTVNGHDDLTVFADNPNSPDYKWWKQLTLITDRSQSMEGVKFDTVKNVLNKQISDAAQEPKGVEFSLATFDNTSNDNQTVFKGQFFADQITPQVNALNTNSAADPNCQGQALSAMAQTLAGKQGGDAWLFTDGEPTQNISVETLVQQLNEHQVKGSFALLGGCASAPSGSNNTSGAEKNFLGTAADGSQPSGVVPYLLTAIGSGGQFLFVDPSKISEAADIMRAQLSHSAGAGRWSDYVSDQPTYRYDKLASWEYNWIDATPAAGGTPVSQGQITLPQPFSFYGTGPFTNAYVHENGYLILGNDFVGDDQEQTTLPNPLYPNNVLYPFWNDINRNVTVCPLSVIASRSDLFVDFYTKQAGDWFAIESNIYHCSEPTDLYQVLLNPITGEIRYQYKSISNHASQSTIGLENATGTSAVQVSYNDINGASDGMGYKFTPAPPQPSRTYTVEVDSLMSSVSFLLTGFSGDFDPMAVQYPDGTLIDCADTANVRCLNLGLVQYVQANVNGHTGVWKATIGAGPSGMGTFSFSSMATSAINVLSSGDRSLSNTTHGLSINLGGVVDGGLLDGWFLKPNGDLFGEHVKFYDDGTHNDGGAGDGRFGSDPFNAPSGGAAYLRVRGTVGGVNFVRADSTPYNFQPLEVKALGNRFNFGNVTALPFQITNLDSVPHCYDRSTQVPEGWTFDWHLSATEAVSGLCLNPGVSITATVDVKLSVDPTNNLPSGTSGEVLVNFIEKEDGKISNSDSAHITRYRDAATVEISNESSSRYLRANSVDTTTLTIFLYDEQEVSVADGTPITLSTTLGTITPVQGFTKHGKVEAIFTASSTEGNVTVTASTGSQNPISATTTIHIHNPLPNRLDLTVVPSVLITDVNRSELIATVQDAWGNPMTDQTVRIGVETDGQVGAINGKEVYTGTTDAAGQITVIFTRMAADVGVNVNVRAELLTNENGQTHVALHDMETLMLLPTSLDEEEEPLFNQRVFMPLIVR